MSDLSKRADRPIRGQQPLHGCSEVNGRWVPVIGKYDPIWNVGLCEPHIVRKGQIPVNSKYGPWLDIPIHTGKYGPWLGSPVQSAAHLHIICAFIGGCDILTAHIAVSTPHDHNKGDVLFSTQFLPNSRLYDIALNTHILWKMTCYIFC